MQWFKYDFYSNQKTCCFYVKNIRIYSVIQALNHNNIALCLYDSVYKQKFSAGNNNSWELFGNGSSCTKFFSFKLVFLTLFPLLSTPTWICFRNSFCRSDRLYIPHIKFEKLSIYWMMCAENLILFVIDRERLKQLYFMIELELLRWK